MSPSRFTAASAQSSKGLTRGEVGDLISHAREANGLPSVSNGMQRQIQILTREWISRTRHLHTISTTLSIVVGIGGFIAGQVLAATPSGYKVWVGVGVCSVLIIFLAIQIFLPKEVMDLGPRGELLSMQLVTQRIAAQLALFHHVESIRAEYDEQSAIKEVNRLIDTAASRQLLSESARLKKVVVTGKHTRWSETVISFGKMGLPDSLTNHFVSIAECVATVFDQAFPGRRFEVKIYLKTEHLLDLDAVPTPVHVLTSVARFPINLHQGWGNHGKSWISCRQGPKADIWESFDSRKVLVYRRVHAADENRIYQTIACIPMPDNTGVITVEADEPSTFLSPEDKSEDGKKIESAERRVPISNNIVSPDLSRSVGSAVKELIVRAIRSDTELAKRSV